MSCRPHDTSSEDGGASDECEISANSAKMQELSPKCRKINRQSLYENDNYAAEFRLGFSV